MSYFREIYYLRWKEEGQFQKTYPLCFSLTSFVTLVVLASAAYYHSSKSNHEHLIEDYIQNCLLISLFSGTISLLINWIFNKNFNFFFDIGLGFVVGLIYFASLPYLVKLNKEKREKHQQSDNNK